MSVIVNSVSKNELSINKPNDSIASRKTDLRGDEKEDGEIDDDDDDDGDNRKKLYCICRTSDTSRFMIGCDNCNEWYHGDCISITEEYAKRIKQFYCLMCRERDSNLSIKYKERKIPKKEVTKDSEKTNVVNSVPKQKPIIDNTSNRNDPDYEPIVKSKKYYDNSDADDDDDDFVANDVKRHTKPKNRRPGRPSKGGKPRMAQPKQRHRKKDESTKKGHKKYNEHIVEVKEGPKQCHGPGCVNETRKGSKYCSDECGIKLATNRIVEILPHRIRQWQSTPCEADERSHRQLEELRNEQQEARRILSDLDVKQKQLEDMINNGKAIPPLTEEETNETENDAESELNVYCVTCGHEVNQRYALKHMERCFNKYESQTSFGSIFKTKIEGQTVFCDVYNHHQGTYCKRLRVLCPEHSKDPKIADDEVCGCPIVTDVFEYTGKFCRTLKKKCNRHYCWEKLRRAELDAERIQQWLKLDDLFEKEQRIRYTMANRHGILGLMLHQTIVHDDGEHNQISH